MKAPHHPGTGISVIVPVWNDAGHLDRQLVRLHGEADEIIVVDGGSEDGLPLLRERYPSVRWLEAPRGRGGQLRKGADAAQGDILLLLHADTELPPDWTHAVRTAVATPGFALGYFPLKIRGARWGYRFIEAGIRARNRLFHMPYGDQALFLRKPDLQRAGGIPAIPLMEDVALVGRLRGLGRVVAAHRPVTTSARRWEKDGLVRRTLINWRTYLAYRAGKAPEQLTGDYAGRSASAVAIFCKQPLPGRVKTRLAREVGPEAAANVYRRLAEGTVACTRGAGLYATRYIFFDPPEARHAVISWLGPDFRYVAQSPGGLGERMASAVEELAARGAGKCVIIGTDCPGLETGHVEAALRALDRRDVVLGPTLDGGYYLVAARRAHPQLFEGIPWSTGRVLETTLRQLQSAGLSYTLLKTLRDIDTRDDLAAAGLVPG